MKNYILFLLAIIMVVLVACESKLVFTEPQPAETETIERFEEAYWGNYFCDSDSAMMDVLFIEFKMIPSMLRFQFETLCLD